MSGAGTEATAARQFRQRADAALLDVKQSLGRIETAVTRNPQDDGGTTYLQMPLLGSATTLTIRGERRPTAWEIDLCIQALQIMRRGASEAE